MADVVGALIFAGVEAAGVAGASALGASTAFSIGATAITFNTFLGTAALIGAPVGSCGNLVPTSEAAFDRD